MGFPVRNKRTCRVWLKMFSHSARGSPFKQSTVSQDRSARHGMGTHERVFESPRTEAGPSKQRPSYQLEARVRGEVERYRKTNDLAFLIVCGKLTER